MRSDALRKPIRHEVQFDVVFEQRFSGRVVKIHSTGVGAP